MQKERIEYIDIAKGILICLLCFHHFPQAVKQVGLPTGDYRFVFFTYKFYACFFMQAFFFITGFCSNFKIDFCTFLSKNVKTLVLPAICFEIIARIVNLVSTGGDFNDLFTLHSYYWFLWTLFICKVLYWTLIQKKDIPFILVFITILSLVMVRFGTFLNFHLGDEGNLLFSQNVLVMFIFLHLGYIANKNKEGFIKTLPFGGGIFLVFLLTNMIIGIKMPQVTAGIGDLDRAYILNYLIVSLTGTMLILYVSKLLKTCEILEVAGKNSLLIYGFHFIFLKGVVVLCCIVFPLNTLTLWHTNVLFVISCTLTFIASYTFSKLINKNKSLSFLTGKW